MKKLLIACLLLAFFAGCKSIKSSSKDPVEPPSELVDFTPTVSVNERWSKDLGDGAARTGVKLRPAYFDGRVYVSDVKSGLYALNASSGSEAWRFSSKDEISSGPGVGDGLVVAGTLEGDVIALSIDSGVELWRAEVSSEVLAAPAIANGVVVVRSQDGRVVGLNATNGSRLWIFDRGVPLLSLRGNGVPLIVNGTVLAGYDSGKLIALNLADGKLIWEQALATTSGRTELERMVDVDGELAVEAAELYAVAYHGQAAGLDAASGRPAWGRDLSSYSGVAKSADRLFVSDDTGVLWSIDLRSGSVQWSQDMLKHRWISTPAVLGKYVVVGDLDGYVHWFNAEDGKLAARKRNGKGRIDTAPLAVDDVVYVLSAKGDLRAYSVN